MQDNSEQTTLNFTPDSLEEFKKVFKEAKESKEHYFFFEGNEYFLGYAKYLIEHLENQFNPLKSDL